MERLRYIYRIINSINGKTYIGQHTVRKNRTITSDTYWGSGSILWSAYKKYGRENFIKEILISGYFSQQEINALEIEYIKKEKSIGKAEYNISDGGDAFVDGHYYWEHATEEQKAWHRDHNKNVAVKASIEAQKNITFEMRSERAKKGVETMCNRVILGQSFKGKQHSEETKRKISEKNKNLTGEKNGSFGKHWWANGVENIKAVECPDGYRKGRICDGSLELITLRNRIKKEKEAQEKENQELIEKILNCGVNLQAYNVYSLLAQKLNMDRKFIQNFVKRHMVEYKHMFYSRIEHMSK